MDFIIEKNIPLPEADYETERLPLPPKRAGSLPINPETGLNSREEQFVDAVINTDKSKLTEKVQEIYRQEGRDISKASASVRASELKKNSKVMTVLEEYVEEAQKGIVEIAEYSTKLGKMGGKDGAAYANVALSAHDKVLDRVVGKAKQSVDITARAVTINMDLTQSLPEET